MSEQIASSDHETADRTPAAIASPANAPVTKDGAERQKLIRKLVALLIVFGAVVLTLYVWSVLERHPRTDDAAARANVVGIVPRARGQIVKLAVQDNQLVKQGDLLFEIDPADYEQALDRAKSALAALDQQIEIGRAQDEELKFGVKAAEAGVQRATAQLKQSEDTLHRLEPLLPKHFATAEQVDEARTKVAVAAQEVAAEEQKLNQARAQLSQLQTLLAQRPGAVAAVKSGASAAKPITNVACATARRGCSC